MTFGIGSLRTTRSTTPASTSSSTAPPALTRATNTSPFAPGLRCNASTATPCFFAKPATAAGGALADGPVTSRSSLTARSATSPTSTARRRGVARSFSYLPVFGARPSATSSSRMPLAKARPSADSALGGSSSVSSSTRRLGMSHRKAEPFSGLVVGLGDAARESTHPADVGSALGDRDRAARVEQVEGVRGLHHHLVAGQHALRLDQAFGFVFIVLEQLKQQLDD